MVCRFKGSIKYLKNLAPQYVCIHFKLCLVFNVMLFCVIDMFENTIKIVVVTTVGNILPTQL
jgi:hypothetical protein